MERNLVKSTSDGELSKITIAIAVVIEMISFIKDIHNSWLYCFTNPFELGTRVSLSHCQPYVSHILSQFKRICETIQPRVAYIFDQMCARMDQGMYKFQGFSSSSVLFVRLCYHLRSSYVTTKACEPLNPNECTPTHKSSPRILQRV